MKKLLLYIITLLFISCNDYTPISQQDYAESLFQQYKMECVTADLAYNTNYYGMGEPVVTRSTDGGYYKNWKYIYDCYTQHQLVNAEKNANNWFVLLESHQVKCPWNNTNNGNIDMCGFNAGDNSGKIVYLQEHEQAPNCSNCSNNFNHEYEKHYVTDGTFTFVEIWCKDANGNNVKAKVYAAFEYNVAKTYLLCVEDLGGNCLDYNDIVILGGENIKPKVIYRGASYPVIIMADNKEVSLPGDTYGKQNIELPFNNMNTPNNWYNAKFICKGKNNIDINIPIKLKSLENQPAVIATEIYYKFHTDENTMVEDEFVKIPFYGR